jgi:hypothetical protein
MVGVCGEVAWDLFETRSRAVRQRDRRSSMKCVNQPRKTLAPTCAAEDAAHMASYFLQTGRVEKRREGLSPIIRCVSVGH